MTEKHTFLSPKGPNYLCLTCGNPDEHEIHGKTYAKRPVEGATGAREWPGITPDGTYCQGGTREFIATVHAKLDGVAQQAAEEIWSDLEKQSYPQVKALDSHIVAYIKHSWAAIISKLIAGRLSK